MDDDTKTDSPQTGPTVYYDGSCPICTFEIAHYRKQAGADQIAFVDASRSDASLGEDLSCSDAMARFHIRQSDGRLVSGAAGFVEIWETLPSWKWAARLAKLPGAMSLLEGAYRVFLPVRPVLSRLAARFGARAENSPTEGTGN